MWATATVFGRTGSGAPGTVVAPAMSKQSARAARALGQDRARRGGHVRRRRETSVDRRVDGRMDGRRRVGWGQAAPAPVWQ